MRNLKVLPNGSKAESKVLPNGSKAEPKGLAQWIQCGTSRSCPIDPMRNFKVLPMDPKRNLKVLPNGSKAEPQGLAQWIQCGTSRSCPKDPKRNLKVLPNGCNAYLICSWLHWARCVAHLLQWARNAALCIHIAIWNEWARHNHTFRITVNTILLLRPPFFKP